MGFAQASVGDTDETATFRHFGDVVSADVEHGLVQATDHLVQHCVQRSAVRHFAFNAFRNDLVVRGDVGLEVAILGVGLLATRSHGAEGAHATVQLVLLAVQQHLLTRSFLAACEGAAEHDGGGTGNQSLGDVAGVVNATVGDARHASGTAGLSGLVHCGELRHTDTGHHAGGADGAWAHANLDCVNTGVDHGLSALTGGHVTADDVNALERGIGLQAANHVESQLGLTVGGVDHEHVHAGFHQSGSTVVGVTQEADAGGNAQTTLFVLGGVRILLGLHEVLHGDQAGEVAFIVNQRQLLDLVLGQQVVGVFLGDVGRAGDEVLAGHDLGNLEPVVILGGDETHVAVGDDADELVVVVNDRQAGDMETAAQLVEISQRHIRADGQRIVDHTGFGALDDVNLSGLVIDGKIAVQHADAAITSHGNGHVGLGDGVHCGGDRRDLHRDVAGQMGGGVHFGRNDIRLVRQQQHIVIGEAKLCENRRKRSVRGICIHIRNCSHRPTI